MLELLDGERALVVLVAVLVVVGDVLRSRGRGSCDRRSIATATMLCMCTYTCTYSMFILHITICRLPLPVTLYILRVLVRITCHMSACHIHTYTCARAGAACGDRWLGPSSTVLGSRLICRAVDPWTGHICMLRMQGQSTYCRSFACSSTVVLLIHILHRCCLCIYC